MTVAPSRCSMCGVDLVGGARVADGVQADAWVDFWDGLFAAMRSHDEARIDAMLAPEFERVSHRAGFSVMERDVYIRYIATNYREAVDFQADVLDASGSQSLTRYHAFGKGGSDVGEWETGLAIVATRDADGRWATAEIFNETDVERARVRFDEISA